VSVSQLLTVRVIFHFKLILCRTFSRCSFLLSLSTFSNGRAHKFISNFLSLPFSHRIFYTSTPSTEVKETKMNLFKTPAHIMYVYIYTFKFTTFFQSYCLFPFFRDSLEIIHVTLLALIILNLLNRKLYQIYYDTHIHT